MYARYQDMPGTTLSQQAILDRLIGDDALVGCVIHVTAEHEGGVRMLDVWSDEAAFHTFQTQHLWPALDRVAAEMTAAGQQPPKLGAFTVVELTGEARWGLATQTAAT